MTNLPREVPVTVCMPVYNGALYVRDAIHSILNQTVIPQEIIVSDGGSSDGTDLSRSGMSTGSTCSLINSLNGRYVRSLVDGHHASTECPLSISPRT